MFTSSINMSSAPHLLSRKKAERGPMRAEDSGALSSVRITLTAGNVPSLIRKQIQTQGERPVCGGGGVSVICASRASSALTFYYLLDE